MERFFAEIMDFLEKNKEKICIYKKKVVLLQAKKSKTIINLRKMAPNSSVQQHQVSFKTDPQLIKDTFTHYSNTFKALCELLTNSIQAHAKEIRVNFEKGDPQNPFDSPIKSIKIWDNGEGIPYSLFETTFMKIGTHHKEHGMGIGRFAAFQIGKVMQIETAAYDDVIKKYTKIRTIIDSRTLTDTLETATIEIQVETFEKCIPQFYCVTITDLYNNDQNCFKRNRLGTYFQDEQFKLSVFEVYVYDFFEKRIRFYLNDEEIKKEDYLLSKPSFQNVTFQDLQGGKHNFEYTFYNIKISPRTISIFLQSDEGGIRQSIRKYGYASKWYTPDLGAWYIYINSDLFTRDFASNFDIESLGERESKNILNNIKQTVDAFFKKRNTDYENFVERLVKDESYPYQLVKNDEIGLQESVFRKTVYIIENNAQLIEKNNDIKAILYPMINKLITDGESKFIIDNVLKLSEDKKKELYELLQKTELEDVIKFSSSVAKKIEFLDLLYELTYGDISSHLKERSQLHKIVQNELWIFNEGYGGTPYLWSDTKLANNLNDLHKKHFIYPLTEEDENLIGQFADDVKDITDLFFYNEKVLTNRKREVMIVELKAPSCAISDKEISQVRRYAYDIQKMPVFPKHNVVYRIYLVSSKMSDRARSEVNSHNGEYGDDNMIEHKHENGEDIRVYVYEWSDLIERNRRALQYLSESLSLKQKSASEILQRDYPNLNVEDRREANLVQKPLQ